MDQRPAAATDAERPDLARAARPARRAARPRIGSGGSPACRSRRRGARLRRRFASCACDRREDPVVVEAGLPGRDDPRSSRARRHDLGPGRVVDPLGVVRVDADGGVEPREPVDELQRAAGTSRRFQPGTRIRSTPASRAAPITWSTSASNRSAWRWQWESTRRTGGLSPMRLEPTMGELAGQDLVDRDRVALAVGPDRVPALSRDLGLRLRDRPAELLDLGDRVVDAVDDDVVAGPSSRPISPRLPRAPPRLARARTVYRS